LDNRKKFIQAPKPLPEIRGDLKPAPLELPSLQARIPQPRTIPDIRPQPTQQTPGRFTQQNQPKKDFSLPKIEPIKPKELIPPTPYPHVIKNHDEDLKRFEEAISNINIDIIHNESPAEEDNSAQSTREEYYRPASMGEGYFSEIEHYVKNHDVNEIIDDIIKKDLLTGMKDYHDTKSQGKPFYFHKEDLKNKLQAKMEQLRILENEWHSIKKRLDENEKKKHEIEHAIDEQSQELKELFKQVKISQWLEQEAPKEQYFKLSSGQELKSLNDLRKALTYMPDDEFSRHVNQERNDFAAWAKDSLQNQELYEKIKEIKTKEELQLMLQKPV
jgi:hypothetical protein